MSDDHPADPGAPSLDDLAAYAIRALDADESAAVEAWLDANPQGEPLARALDAAGGEWVAAQVGVIQTPTPPALRNRIVGLAHDRRAPVALVPASPAEVHRIELERAIALLRDLPPDRWHLRLDPPEFAGWTIHDLASHLVANESLLAQQLGVPVPGIPEPQRLNEDRTHAMRTRHRGSDPRSVIDELQSALVAVDATVTAGGEGLLGSMIDWWGSPTTVRLALLVRSFETWTHADDIRRACGYATMPPPAPSLRTMGRAATGWIPLMLVADGRPATDEVARLRLTGPGGGAWDVRLSAPGEVHEAGTLHPDTELTLDIVEFCRAVGDRRPEGGPGYRTEGDAALARRIVDALPALAVL